MMSVLEKFSSISKIAITGRMGTGKTTMANLLALSGYKQRSIAQKIREIVQEIDLPQTRDILQETGRFYRQWDENVWIRVVVRQSREDVSQGLKTVVDDVRFLNEVTLLQKEDFLIVRLHVPSVLRKKRIEKRDNLKIDDKMWEEWQNHSTEQQIDQIIPDIEIDNSQTLEEFEQKIQDLLGNFEKKKIKK